jgi:hypothetical protein
MATGAQVKGTGGRRSRAVRSRVLGAPARIAEADGTLSCSRRPRRQAVDINSAATLAGPGVVPPGAYERLGQHLAQRVAPADKHYREQQAGSDWEQGKSDGPGTEDGTADRLRESELRSCSNCVIYRPRSGDFRPRRRHLDRTSARV